MQVTYRQYAGSGLRTPGVPWEDRQERVWVTDSLVCTGSRLPAENLLVGVVIRCQALSYLQALTAVAVTASPTSRLAGNSSVCIPSNICFLTLSSCACPPHQHPSHAETSAALISPASTALQVVTELAQRVGDWRSRIDPLLKAEESRASFDLQSYGEKILGKLVKRKVRLAQLSFFTHRKSFPGARA